MLTFTCLLAEIRGDHGQNPDNDQSARQKDGSATQLSGSLSLFLGPTALSFGSSFLGFSQFLSYFEYALQPGFFFGLSYLPGGQAVLEISPLVLS